MPLPPWPAEEAAAGNTLTLDVANDLLALREASAAVRRFADKQQLAERLAFQLDLVLEEMLMNRIEHAFAPGERGLTRVQVQMQPDAVTLTFADSGVAFDPLQQPPPKPATSLQEVRVGGRGLLLTRKAARECHYARRDGRNYFAVVLDR